MGKHHVHNCYPYKKKISKTVQSSDESVESFFTKIKGLWDVFDNLNQSSACVSSGCSCEINKKMVRIQQGRRLMEFLMKISPKHQHIRSNILMMKEPSSATEAYRILMQEQTHQEFSKGSNGDEQETPIACRVDNKRKFGEKKKFVLNMKASY